MVRRAKRREILERMSAALGAESEVMHVREDRVPTAWHSATSPVTAQHCAPECRWDGLRGAACTHVGICVEGHARRLVIRADVSARFETPQALPVALRHLYDLRRDIEMLTPTLLRSMPTALANGERHLIARAPLVSRSFEDVTAEQQHGCIVVERVPGVVPHLRHRLAKRREHLARYLEPE